MFPLFWTFSENKDLLVLQWCLFFSENIFSYSIFCLMVNFSHSMDRKFYLDGTL